MRQGDLAVLILQDVAVSTLQHTGRATAISRRMFAELFAATTGLYTHKLHAHVIEEGVEQSDRVAASADTRNRGVRQPAFRFQNLPPRLVADHAMKIAHHH